MTRPLRIGHQLSGRVQGSPIDIARRAEELGFDIVLASDHVGLELAPLPTLAAIASATTTIRLGTLVLNNDMRNPVQVAWDVASIDVLSGGRFELGLGAGHTPQEYTATGIERSAAVVRKQRLAESVEIIRALLDGETVDRDGEYYRIEHARIASAAQDRLPILVGGNGAALLGYAGAHADIVGLQGLGRTLADGHNHTVDWRSARLDAQLAEVRAGAAERYNRRKMRGLLRPAQRATHLSEPEAVAGP